MIRGRDVLYALCDCERTLRSPLAGTSAQAISRRAGGKDGRTVTAKLKRLEGVGFVYRPYPNLPRWATTARGQEVERLCSESDAKRGGSFRPLVDVLTDLMERLALR